MFEAAELGRRVTKLEFKAREPDLRTEAPRDPACTKAFFYFRHHHRVRR